MSWRLVVALAPAIVAGCAAAPSRGTIGELHAVEPDVAEVAVDNSLDLATVSYRRYLEETPINEMTPEAMRRLADLQLEKEFGITGDGERWQEMAAPEPGATPESAIALDRGAASAPDVAAPGESDAEFEERAGQAHDFVTADVREVSLPGGENVTQSGPLEAIAIYKQLLAQYPNYERADQVLYQMARAYDELGETEEAMQVTERLIAEYGYSKYFDEIQFRRGEYFFTRRRWRDAESAYQGITARAAQSEFYELALYKLGWTLYKQEFYEEALQQYTALLDHKLAIGYDFDTEHEEDDERRVADTFRVVSLSFSNLGGPEVLAEYFSTHGNRSYEDRIYKNLGEFYFDKLRYNDAAQVYGSFVDLYPFHTVSPSFGMRVIEIYEAGSFPKLVLEAKKEFATAYGLQSQYWQHFDTAERPEVLTYLKTNLKDLANHYHSLYQDEGLADEKSANYGEASRWYREFLVSFPADTESPGINYQLADLLLENSDFVAAAREYERTAYEYALHERAAAAGYAAIFAHREHLKAVAAEEETAAKRATVESSLRFATTFPDHEHAPAVLSAAAEDLYAMRDYTPAVSAAQMFIASYPTAPTELQTTAWTVVAHSSLELADYGTAEAAYTRVLELTPAESESRQTLIDNLAASIYKQGESANQTGDYSAAAAHFLRIKSAAPTSAIRPSAEYDAAAALMRLQDWTSAAKVLDDFRSAFPGHELEREATKQLAFVYREGGSLGLAAGEYERVATESEDPALRSEALLASGDLYEQAGDIERALAVYERYVVDFPRPAEVAIETRSKIAGMYKARGEDTRYREELAAIVAADGAAGAERTDRTQYLAAQAAFVLAEPLYATFAQVELVQPFEQNLARKRELMDTALSEFEKLIDYEVADVTAAATFYMAEVYFEFSRAMLESERPTDLDAAGLAEYEEVIESEAFPFEELAIEVHEKNLELVASGVYNAWIEKSFGRLADLVPGRYAKAEQSIGFIGDAESYTYQPPSVVAALAAAGAYGPAASEDDARAARRARGEAQKSGAPHLEVIDGVSFTITEAARLDDKARAEYATGLGYLERGQLQPGIAALVGVTEQAPDLASAHIDLGVAYARAGDLERAAASLEQSLTLSGGVHPVAANELGLVYRRQGRFALARESFEKALAPFPDFHFARRNLGILCDLYLRDLACALENYEAYSAQVPEDTQVSVWIADIRSRVSP
jgi:tetratricopeptide (TPR) repeat protein